MATRKTITKKSLDAQIQKLVKQREKLEAKQRAPAIATIVRLVRQFGITTEEIQKALGSRRGRKAAGTAPAAKKSKLSPVAPKYRNNDTGETWSGRGKPPRWLTAAEQGGKSRESFLIAPAA